MKKVLFTVALMFGAFVASAQVSVVKEAKGMMKKDPAAAAKLIEGALTNPETANDPNTWQMAGDIQKAMYDEENMKMYLPGGQADMPKMYRRDDAGERFQPLQLHQEPQDCVSPRCKTQAAGRTRLRTEAHLK